MLVFSPQGGCLLARSPQPQLLQRKIGFSVSCSLKRGFCLTNRSFIRHGDYNRHSFVMHGSYGTAGGYGGYAAVEDVAEINLRNQVAKTLEEVARKFKRLGALGFWAQFVCNIVSAVVLAFSILVSGVPTAPVTQYLTAAGISAGFISVFWSFGYMRLAAKLRGSSGNPSKAPPRADVVSKLKKGIALNVIGMAATVMGMQATVGLLVVKALKSPAAPFLQGPYAGQSPVLALDVFLVQACANAILSHFVGLLFNLELLRTVTRPQPSLKPV